jgi:hypothetical protein
MIACVPHPRVAKGDERMSLSSAFLGGNSELSDLKTAIKRSRQPS